MVCSIQDLKPATTGRRSSRTLGIVQSLTVRRCLSLLNLPGRNNTAHPQDQYVGLRLSTSKVLSMTPLMRSVQEHVQFVFHSSIAAFCPLLQSNHGWYLCPRNVHTIVAADGEVAIRNIMYSLWLHWDGSTRIRARSFARDEQCL